MNGRGSTFSKSIKLYKVKTMEEYVRIKRKASIALFSHIIISTPVDTGALAANWIMGLGQAPQGKLPPPSNPAGAQQNAIAAMASVVSRGGAEQDFVFVNNMHYAQYIEFDGHSSLKAPAGMVRINLPRWERIVRQAAAAVRRQGR